MITRDNVPVEIDGVVFFIVSDPERAVLTIQDYRLAVSQYAKASLRDVVGSMTLDALLSERDQIQARLATVVEERAKSWGIHVDSIRLLDIDMPEDQKRMMSRQASAEREKRATITKAEGDKEAASNLATAAETMARSPGRCSFERFKPWMAWAHLSLTPWCWQSRSRCWSSRIDFNTCSRERLSNGPPKHHVPLTPTLSQGERGI